MNTILNISAYKFVQLKQLPRWREALQLQAQQQALKGTVLLAEEGINLFVAGLETPVRHFLAELMAHPELQDLPCKESWSSTVPFSKLHVKIKPEIIRMNHPTIQPQAQRAPAVDAATLASWLDAGVDDAGRPVVMLDARNAFEVDQGRFNNACDWRINKFSEFPQALLTHQAQLQGKTVVSYCTGGIRCEKAALFMAQAGVEHVLQLEGGILKYFEETGGKHFEGDCFVFDERAAVNASLAPVKAA
jgi:UPF0176 protein